MSLAELYISRPGVSFPANRVDNAEILRRVHACFKGSAENWKQLESAIEQMWGFCKTRYRYLETDNEARVADLAVAAAKH